MTSQVLQIDSSIKGDQSVTRHLTKAVLARLMHRDAGRRLIYRDLAADPLSHLLEVPTASPADDLILSEFLASAVVVLGAPMYNFSIPSQLKVWIDRIVIPGKTFQYTREGPKPVLRSSQKIIVASACGDNYGSQQSAPMDEMESYLRHVFGFIGVDDVCVIRAEGVALHRADVIAEALRQFDRNN